MAEDHSGACAYSPAAIHNLGPIPVAANVDQDVVRLRLTIQARAGRAEGACRPFSRQ